MAVRVPKGNRQAILIHGSRADFGGDLNVGVEGLPPGVAIEAARHGRQPGGRPRPLHRQARCARWRGTLASLTGKPADPKLNVPSEFSSTAALVLGQNNVIVWSRTVDRLAVAVTEECPYTIEIVEPKVPLVRGGSMGLKVGRTASPASRPPISVYLPWNPPGVGSAGGIAHPRRAERGRHPHERRRRRRAADLEDRRQRRLGRGQRADPGLVATGQPDDRRALTSA